MKFTKTALAVAVASIAVAPMAQADVTLSGFVSVLLKGTDLDDDPTTPGDESAMVVSSDDSTINVFASHDTNNGLTGYANWRMDVGLSNDPGFGVNGDNIHVGIKGDFGDIRAGEVPDALEYGQVANDALVDIGGEERGISYTGSFGPATFGVNFSPEGLQNGAKAGNGSDKIAAGVKFSLGGFGIGIGGADVGDDTRFSAGATYSFSGASVALAYKDLDNGLSTIGGTLGYGIGAVSLKLTYEARSADTAAEGDGDSVIRLDAGYDLGGGLNASVRINQFTDDSDSAGDNAFYWLMLSKTF